MNVPAGRHRWRYGHRRWRADRSPGRPVIPGEALTELGIRPEFIRLTRDGLPVEILKIEDIGRQKIVRARFAGQPIAVVLREDADVPAEPKLSFDTAAINIYANSWRADYAGAGLGG